MKNVALLGGAFDPPTKGHMAIAEAVLELPDIDEVWFMPCYIHMFDKTMRPYRSRVEMLRLMANGNDKLNVFQFELENNLDTGSTHELLTILKDDYWYSEFNFHFIVGLDNANSIEKWHRWEEIIELAAFIVLPRDDQAPNKKAWYSKKPHRILDKEIPSVSSTLARACLFSTDESGARDTLTKDVYDYICTEGLYRE